MTVSRYATQAGRKFQRDCMKYLREQGYDAENLVLTGAEDEGDILLRKSYISTAGLGHKTNRFVIECKREKGFHLGGWVKQAQLERAHYAEHRNIEPLSVGWVVIHAARGKPLGQAYVTTTVDEWLRRL